MTLISLREHGTSHTGPVAVFDGQEYPMTIGDPFTDKQEARLEWYFEEHLRFPFVEQVRARDAAASITTYGEALFKQVFLSDPRVYGRYVLERNQGIEQLAFEVAGSPEFQHYHWEALKDPELPQPFALHAPFVRRNLQPRPLEAQAKESPTINVLVVTARPAGRTDVGYRTIARPLVETLRQANLPVQVEILRPGTYEALVEKLESVREQHGAGYYHVIHFDVHGALLTYAQLEQGFQSDQLLYQTRYGRADIQAYDSLRAYLFLESERGGPADPVAADELAQLLLAHRIPIAILNACQSGKQVGDRETSLGNQLMQAGLQTVLAMSYSVTVSAAALMMAQLYAHLFERGDLAAAIRRARLELHNRKGRRAYFDQTIDLEDWLLPVVYQNQAQQLKTRALSDGERAARYARLAARYPEPRVAYRFVGRDLDILHIERCLLTRNNLLLLRGMGGAGKTTLLHHLGAWWQTTGLVDQVFYFGYDERAWTRQQILAAIARQLLGEQSSLPPGPEAQEAFLAERLRARRHLLILDNLESITGSHLAIQNTLPATEQQALHDWLRALAGGKTLVLLGSRGGETWLGPGAFGDNVYALPGLDPEAASTLAELVLARQHATQYRADPDLARLLKLLDGYPLALEVVLANLAQQTPAQVLAALQAGLELDNPNAQDKTQSILRCIDYAHGNLAPDAQALLLCLGPFSSVINVNLLEQYTAQLRQQPELAHLPFAR